MIKTWLAKRAVIRALGNIQALDSTKNVLAAGLVRAKNIQIGKDGAAIILIEGDPARAAALEPIRQAITQAAQAIKNITKVTVVLTAQKTPGKSQAPSAHAVAPPGAQPKKTPSAKPLRIKHVIAIASGKGGVGKSTVAANLAVACAKQGLKTGLLDADMYGPSVPRMMGLAGQKPEGTDGHIEPLTAHGVKLASIGFMVAEDEPLIWRGPLLHRALGQLLGDVNWGALDVLFIDMPPGTGDVALSIAQKVPLSGAVIVSTPQDIALLDVRKGIAMFEKTNIPVLGMIENMSSYICPSCGHEEHIFGHGGAQEDAQRLNIPFLGAIPLNITVRENADAGTPTALEENQDGVFTQIVQKLSL